MSKLMCEENFHPDNEKLAIIINQWKFYGKKRNRTGTHKDVDNLIDKLQKLKCDYAVFHDSNQSDILTVVPEYVKLKLEKLNKPVGLIFFILTHGGAKGVLKAYDKDFNLYDFVNKFNPATFPIMAEQPKLFFISACRGGEFQPTEFVHLGSGKIVADHIMHEPIKRPKYKNLLLAFSTYNNNYSIRDENVGTFFIQKLCERFDAFICDKKTNEADIMDILLETNNLLIQKPATFVDPVTEEETEEKQVAEVYSSLTAPYFFKKNV